MLLKLNSGCSQLRNEAKLVLITRLLIHQLARVSLSWGRGGVGLLFRARGCKLGTRHLSLSLGEGYYGGGMIRCEIDTFSVYFSNAQFLSFMTNFKKGSIIHIMHLLLSGVFALFLFSFGEPLTADYICLQLLGLPDQAEKDEIVKSVMQLKRAEVEEGYTMDAVKSREVATSRFIRLVFCSISIFFN